MKKRHKVGSGRALSISGRSLRLTKAQTRLYEDRGPSGDSFRREAREAAQKAADASGHNVEIYSHDGITFEQLSPESNYWEDR